VPRSQRGCCVTPVYKGGEQLQAQLEVKLYKSHWVVFSASTTASARI